MFISETKADYRLVYLRYPCTTNMAPQASALTAADTDIDCVSSTASTNNSNTDGTNKSYTKNNNRQGVRGDVKCRIAVGTHMI